MVSRETYDSLAPKDAAVALRSYPRRYREALEVIADGRDIDEIATRVGPEGTSPVELVTDTAQSIALLARSIETVIHDDDPVLLSAVTDRSARSWTASPGSATLQAALDSLAEDATALANRADHTSIDDWTRTGRVTGAGNVSALELLREAIATATTNLRRLESTDW